MKKIILILLIYFIKAPLYANEVIYLRCAGVITKNLTLGEFGKVFKEGREIRRHYIEMNLDKDTVKISDDVSMEEYMKMGSYSKSVKGFKGKAKIVNEEIKFKDAHKDTKIRIKTDVLLSKKNGEWEIYGNEVYDKNYFILNWGLQKTKLEVWVNYAFQGQCKDLNKDIFLYLKNSSK